MSDSQIPFEEDDFNFSKAREQKIRDIIGKENLLKRERQKLVSEKPWYKKPEILVAVFGIIVPIIASYIISNNDIDKKEITINVSQFEPIISEVNNIKGNLTISYDSSKVTNISKLTLKIKNTGNVSLKKSDFVDGPLSFQINYKENLSTILQVNKTHDANQQNSLLNYYNSKAFSKITYMPSLLNRGDEITIESYFLNTPTNNISVIGKIEDGNIIGPKPIESKDSKIGYKTFILSINSFFGIKWLTIASLIILFIFSALSGLLQFGLSNDDDYEPASLMMTMASISSIFAILTLAFTISVLVYV